MKKGQLTVLKEMKKAAKEAEEHLQDHREKGGTEIFEKMLERDFQELKDKVFEAAPE